MSLASLPRDTLFEIGSYLGIRELNAYALTNKKINEVCKDYKIRALDNNATLLPYQIEYIKWILSNERNGPHRGIINLTMGSGKTLTILTSILLNRGGLTLAIVDPSLLAVWVAEIEKFYAIKEPIKYVVYHGEYQKSINFDKLEPNTLVLTTPQTLKGRISRNTDNIRDASFYRIVVDEVHSFGEYTGELIRKCLKYTNLWVVSATPYNTAKNASETFNKNIVSLLGCNKGNQYLYNEGKGIETPEVRQMPLHINLFKSAATPYDYMCEYITRKPHEKMLIFCNVNRCMTIKDVLAKTEISFLVFDSSSNPRKREVIYHTFKTDPSYQVLVCTFTVASNGLNLAEANHSIFMDIPSCFGERAYPDKNKLIQALGRIYRYGQTKPCFININNNDDQSIAYKGLIEKAFPNATFNVE